MEYYRLQKVREGSLILCKEDGELDPASEIGMRKEKEEMAHLSEIIKILNDKFGTDFTDAEQLFVEQLQVDMVANEGLAKQGRNNPIGNFKYGFDDVFMDTLINRMELNEAFARRIIDYPEFAATVKEFLMRSVYRILNEGNATSSVQK